MTQPQEAGACPHCGAPVEERVVRDQGAVERAGCLACGLQLVRRRGERWEGIRG